MEKKINRVSDNYCNVLEQRRLVAEMTRCDRAEDSQEIRYECYLRAARESRESQGCLYG